MTPPRSIAWFAIALALMVLVNLIHGAIASDAIRAIAPEYTSVLGDAVVPLVLAVRVLFSAWLGWLIVRRANAFAKWVVVALMVIKLRSIGEAWTGLQAANVSAMLWTLAAMLGLFAVTCLFMPASRFWFSSKGRSMSKDAAVFE